MKINTVLSIIAFLVLATAQTNYAQLTNPADLLKPKELKTNVVGSYPTEIWEYNWIVEYWSPYQKQYISYTGFGQPSEVVIVGLDGERRTIYSYNAQQNIEEKLEQKKSDGEWVNDRRETTAYNQDMLETSFLVESWIGSGWVLMTGTEYVYDTSQEGSMTVLVKIWSREDGEWINSARITYSYGSGMLLSELVTEVWEGGIWVNSSKSIFIYEDGHLKEMIMSGWLNNAWSESTKMVYEYGENDSQTMTLYTGTSSNWVPSQRFTDNFDDHGNTILTTVEIFIADWVMLSGSEYILTYEGDNLVERITRSYSMSEPSSPPVKSGGTWKNVYKEEFKSFASLSTDPIAINSAKIVAFPNPANEEVSLKFENIKDKEIELSVIDLSGRTYLTTEVYISSGLHIYELKLKDLPAGTFILQARNKEGKLISSSKLLHSK